MSAGFKPSEEKLKEMEDIVLRINKYLGYDFNTVELALRDGVPYAIDFCNPAPDADVTVLAKKILHGLWKLLQIMPLKKRNLITKEKII